MVLSEHQKNLLIEGLKNLLEIDPSADDADELVALIEVLQKSSSVQLN